MKRRSISIAVAAVATLALALPAGAAPSFELRVREAVLAPDGSTRLVVAATGDAAGAEFRASDFRVFEAGRLVSGVSSERLLDAKTQAVSVMLAMDVSGSTVGRPLADARAAAKAFVTVLPPIVRVGVVEFGPGAFLRAAPTTDRAAVVRALDAMKARGGTALYDGVSLAASTVGKRSGQRNIVLFSDGRDNGSKASFAAAIAAVEKASAQVTSVGLVTQEFDAAALDRFASASGGSSFRVDQSAELLAAFAQVSRELTGQYVLAYQATTRGPRELDLAVELRHEGETARDTIALLNPRVGIPAGALAPRAVEPKPVIGPFASDLGLWVGFGAILAGFTMLFVTLLRRANTKAERAMRRGLRFYTKAAGRGPATDESESGLAATAFGRAAQDIVEKVPRGKAYEEAVQLKLDRAGWPLRATEFTLLQVAGLVVGAALGFGVLGSWWLGATIAVAFALAPNAVLVQRTAARHRAFAGQMPDTLQLMAGSMQAGYGFMQAIDTVVKESPAPTSTEYGRVLAEARLGMPIDEALNGMADRVASEDFRWVVLAINIQRQVGGNLADLLGTVANTLREREAVRRQIKVLSAEGRLSAVVLTILPFAIAGWIFMVNPGYLQTLTSESLGRVMIGGAAAMMVAGILWMRKLVRIEV